jgi:glycolate oxidase FAD binding subunit
MDEVIARWSERIRAAAADGTKLCIRGGGSKDFYGGLPDGELFDTREYRGIVSYEPTELVVTVRAGTPLAEVEAALAEKGQWLAFEPPTFGGERDKSQPPNFGGERNKSQPPHFGSERDNSELPNSGTTTVGGVVAAGLSGPRRPQAGAVRDFVLGVRLLDGRGELLRFGGEVMKNVAGYDVSRLLAGSLGTLGVIADVSLKVLPRPVAETTIVFEAPQAKAIERMNRWAGQPLPISAACWVDDQLCIRLSGARAAVAAAADKLGGDRLEAADAFWGSLRDQTHAFFAGRPLWRFSVGATAPVLDLPAAQLVEWGGAQRWCVTDASPPQLREVAAKAGGHATLFRTRSSEARAAGVFTPLSAPLMAVHRRLKQTFDPAAIFNPRRLYPEL